MEGWSVEQGVIVSFTSPQKSIEEGGGGLLTYRRLFLSRAAVLLLANLGARPESAIQLDRVFHAGGRNPPTSTHSRNAGRRSPAEASAGTLKSSRMALRRARTSDLVLPVAVRIIVVASNLWVGRTRRRSRGRGESSSDSGFLDESEAGWAWCEEQRRGRSQAQDTLGCKRRSYARSCEVSEQGVTHTLHCTALSLHCAAHCLCMLRVVWKFGSASVKFPRGSPGLPCLPSCLPRPTHHHRADQPRFCGPAHICTPATNHKVEPAKHLFSTCQ